MVNNKSTSQINSHLRWFLHDAVPRPEEDIDGSLVVGAVIGSSHSKVCKLNIISSCVTFIMEISSVLSDFLSPLKYGPVVVKARVLLVIYPT